jgi:hypothetical protein
MRDARKMSLVCLGGCLAFVLLILYAVGPLGAGEPRPLDLLPSAADAPDAAPPGAEPQAVYDLATLPPAEAVRLQGRRELYRVRLDSAPAEVGAGWCTRSPCPAPTTWGRSGCQRGSGWTTR